MKNKLLSVCLVIAICLTLSGCRYSHEITEMAYAVALGIDKADEGLRISVQFARPLSISGGSGSEGGGESSDSGEDNEAAKNKNTTVLSVNSKDFYTALSVIENSLSKEINLSHIKLLLFSEPLAQDGISDFVQLLMKNSQFSPNTYTAITRSTAEEYMRTANPSLEINPAKYYTLIFSNNDNSYMPSATLRELYFNLSAPGKEPVMPVANLNNESEAEGEKQHGNFLAGELSVGSENKTDVSGMAVLSDGKLSQILSTHDAVAYNILSGRLHEAYITLPSETEENKNITARLTQDKKTKLCADELENNPKLSARISLCGELLECPESDIKKLGIDGINRLMSEAVNNQLYAFLDNTKTVCRADVIGFGKKAKMKFKDWDEWLKYNWHEKYTLASFNLETKVNITNEGLINN